MSGTGPDHGLRWRFELYRTPTGPGHTTAAKGTSAEAGTGNRLGVWHTLDLSGRPSVRDGPVGLSGPAGADVVRVHRGWGGRWDGQRFVNFSPDYEQMRED